MKVNHASEDVVDAVKAATDGRGADVVVESVGQATWERSLQAARTGGRITVCGATSGPNPPAALHRIWWKQLTIYGSTMGTKTDFEGVYELVKSGRAKPIVDAVFPLSEARAAHERMEAGDQLGKIVLTIPASAVGSGLLDEGREERVVLALLRVPEHAEREAVRRILDRLDRPVLGPGALAQPVADPTEALVVRRLHRRAVAEDRAEPRIALDPHLVVRHHALLMPMAVVADDLG